MKNSLDGKRAVVTGGTSDIGEAIALAQTDAGARTASNYVSQAEAAESPVFQDLGSACSRYCEDRP